MNEISVAAMGAYETRQASADEGADGAHDQSKYPKLKRANGSLGHSASPPELLRDAVRGPAEHPQIR
jgi:hypothetical protein